MIDTNTTASPSSAISIALAWLVVIVPAVWGIYFTSLSAAKLFQ
jgi:hypothetical protein